MLPARTTARFRRLLLLGFLLYIACCAALVRGERHLLYLPGHGPTTPQAAKLVDYTRQSFVSYDGITIPYWEHIEPGNAPILLYFHGNGGGLYAFAPALDYLAKSHFQVIAMEYRGYPSAPSTPSETAILKDAVALYDHTKKLYPNRPIDVWGYSLGTGVASQLAVQRQVTSLVLEAPFTAAVDRAAELYPMFPIHWLMHDQYRSRDVIANIHAPLFIMHGDDDRIIPERMGAALYTLAAYPKTFHHYAHAGHLNLITTPAYADAVNFLRAPPAPQMAAAHP